MNTVKLVILFAAAFLAQVLTPKGAKASVWYPILVAAVALLFIATELWGMQRARSRDGAGARSGADRTSNILAALLVAAFLLLQWFNPPQNTSYARIVEERHETERATIEQQLANFAAQTGAITNEWSLPGATRLRRGSPSVTAEAVEQVFAGLTNTAVISVVPRELKFSVADDLPDNFNHVLVGLHLGHTVSDASLEVHVAVKDDFWQMVQTGHGQAIELLVALRGIQVKREQPAWSKKPKVILRGFARNLQWFEPAP